MPSVGALARGAWDFERAISGAPLTMPSVATLMTGLYPDRTGVVSHDRRTRLDVDSPCLAELARAAGYRTAAVVANPWLASRTTRFDRGFDVYKTRRTEKLGHRRLDARTATDLAIEILENARAPLFLWVHYIDPHMPYQPPLEDAVALGNPEGSSAIVRDFISERIDRETIYFEAPYNEEDLEATRRLYGAAARYVDREVGRLLAAVDQALGRDKTIVVFTADHGESLGEHGLFFAHDFTLYEELAHVPLIVRLPEGDAARIEEPVSLADVLPTLCARSRLECPDDLDGVALSPEPRSSRPIFSVGPPHRARYGANPFVRVHGLEGRWTAVRVAESKLIRIPRPSGIDWEAYDLEDDPAETRDVFDERLHGPLVASLESWIAAQHAARSRAGDEAPARSAARLGRETVEELRALGYLQ
jgi:arylsulfatase A-like enzyme